MSRTSRFALPSIAAALALAFTAPMIADVAVARPVRPDWQHGSDRLRAENEELRAELGLYQAAYSELSGGLDRIDAANRRNRDRRAALMIDRAARNARERAAQYVQPWSYEQQQPDWRDRDDWRTMPSPPMLPPGSVRDRRTQPGPQIQVMEMDARAFAALTTEMGRAHFADDKLALVKTAAATNYFTVAQVVQLMKLASFDDTRVEIAVALSPRVLDGDKWFEVYGALSFSSSRDALRQRLGDR